MSVNVELLDINALTEAKETMKNQFPTMVEYYIEDSATYIAEIHEGIKTQNIERIVSPSHALKSSSTQMGALRVSVIAKEIEERAREQANAGSADMAAFTPFMGVLQAAFEETKTALKVA